MSGTVQVAVTGAAGNVGNALVFRLASGEVFGPSTRVVLRLLEVPAAMPALEGVAMELLDCAFPLLADVVVTASPSVGFDGASWALLLGSSPRRAGQERGDLLQANAAAFVPQGRALAAHAAADVRVLVVGNPCNTNCLVARAHAPDIPDSRWFAMTRLDENRAKAQLALRAGLPVREVTRLAIWGNHSATQYPDAWNAQISGRPAPLVLGDDAWLSSSFVPLVQERGAAIIAARGSSSVGSAANAVVDTVRAVAYGTPPGDWTSVGVLSKGEYGVPPGLVFSYPVVVSPDGTRSVVEDLPHSPDALERLRVTTDELIAEQKVVSSL
jgi:malate dehydrogenase